ncbi:MAG TPA: alpha/beta hydrolase [Frankiaceae bacterium]|nr:alpha/beta hydrolase [Frankiaceae bacterium]
MTTQIVPPDGVELHLPENRWADLDGPVRYVDFGGPADGPVIVCVHGLGGSLVNWLALAPRLTQTFHVLALDLAGHGLTEAAGRGTDVHSNRRLLDRFLREVVGGPVILFGNSMGGLITLLQADKSRDLVTGMVLVDPALPRPGLQKSDPMVAKAFAAYALPMIGERVLRKRNRTLSPEQLVAETLALCCVDPGRVPDAVKKASVALVLDRKHHASPEKAFLGAARSLLKLLARPKRYLTAIARVPQPTLLIFGAKDRLVPLSSGERAARGRPDWRFAVHPDLGHVPMLEDAAWTAEAILNWLVTEGATAARAATRF